MKRSGIGFGAVSQTGFLQGLSAAITESAKVRDCEDAIASTRHACPTPRKRAAGTFRSRLRWRTINYRLSLISQRHGRGAGVGRGLGVGAGLGVGVALGVDVAVGVGDADAVAVAVGVAVAVAVGVGEGDAQGLTGQVKISIEAIGAPLAS